VERLELIASPNDAPTSQIRPARIWSIAMGAAVMAALIAWGIEEASLKYYRPQLTAASAPRDYRPDLWVVRADEPGGGRPPGARAGGGRISQYGANRATMAMKQEFTAKAIAVSGGAVGALFGLALGLAVGLSGGVTARSSVRALAAAIFGASVCGAAGWLATWALVPLFYRAQIENPSNSLVMVSLLLIRGVPRIIAGLAGGLTLGVALGGGGSRMIRGAVGGMVGAAIGVALVVIGDEVIALLASQQEIVTSPILRSPSRRIVAILAVTLPSAAGAAWAILNMKTSRDAVPRHSSR
jgi:hypothetical protein